MFGGRGSLGGASRTFFSAATLSELIPVSSSKSNIAGAVPEKDFELGALGVGEDKKVAGWNRNRSELAGDQSEESVVTIAHADRLKCHKHACWGEPWQPSRGDGSNQTEEELAFAAAEIEGLQKRAAEENKAKGALAL